MNCSTCGHQLPSGAKACPNCGTLTPAYFADSGASPSESTVASTSSSVPLASLPSYNSPGANGAASRYGPATPVPPSATYPSNPYSTQPASSTGSGADPYSVPFQNPYGTPPPPPPRRRNRLALLIASVILILILIGGGIFALLRFTTPSGNTTTPTPTGPRAAQLHATATAHAQATATAQSTTTNATATATALQNPYPPFGGTLTLNDPLQDNSKGYQWDILSDSTSSCTFTGGAYHISESQQGFFEYCNTKSTHFSDFAYQVQMTIIKGDAGGILFRTDNTGNNFYYFRIGRDGSYILYLSNGNNVTALRQKASPAIKTGLNQPNLIAVVAQGNKFDLYVNKKLVDTVMDKTYIEGRIGVAADDDNNPTEVMFNNAMVWIL